MEPGSEKKPAAAPVVPVVPDAVRRKVAARALKALAGLTLLAAAAAAVLYVQGRGAAALSVAVGHTVGALCGISWILGAALSFGSPFMRFALSTLGLSPVRLLLVAGAVFAAGVLGPSVLDPLALALALIASRSALHIIEALSFSTLADASRAARAPRPVV